MPTIETLTVDLVTRTSKFTTGLRVAAAGLTAFATGAGFAFKQFEDSEKLVAQTEAVIKSTGGVANVTAQDISRLSSKLMEQAAIDDEVIRAGQNMLLTFKNIRNEAGKGNAIFDRATKTLVDLSVAMGKDPKTAAIQLGKALNDPVAGISALSRVGVQFSDSQERMITKLAESGDILGAQKIILKELDSQFGGSAKAQATASAAMSVSFGELAERLGRTVAPAATMLLDALSKLADFMQRNVGPAMKVVRDWLTKVWERVRPVAEIFGSALLSALRQVWNIIVTNLWPALKDLFQALQPVLKIIGLIVGTALMGLIKALPVVVRLLAGVISVLAKVVGAIGKVIEVVGRAIVWIRDRFVGAWQRLKEVAIGIWDGIKTVAMNAIQAIVDFFKGAINFVIRRLNDVIYAINLVKPGSDISEIPELALGGKVLKTGIAVVHRGEFWSGVGQGLERVGAGERDVNVNVSIDRRRYVAQLTHDRTFRGW